MEDIGTYNMFFSTESDIPGMVWSFLASGW